MLGGCPSLQSDAESRQNQRSAGILQSHQFFRDRALTSCFWQDTGRVNEVSNDLVLREFLLSFKLTCSFTGIAIRSTSSRILPSPSPSTQRNDYHIVHQCHIVWVDLEPLTEVCPDPTQQEPSLTCKCRWRHQREGK